MSKICGHNPPIMKCGICYPKNRTAPPESVGVICIHRSEDPLSIAKTLKLGLSPIKLWFDCSNGYGVVCQCNCNSACKGFEK